MMKSIRACLTAIILTGMAFGCAAAPTGVTQRSKRFAMVIGLKPDKMDYYKQLHANPWQGVLDQLERSNIHRFSINLVEMKKGEYYLFGYFEYTGNDFDTDMAAMGEDETTQRWWRETDPCQYPIETAKEALDKKAQWTMMEEVFYNP